MLTDALEAVRHAQHTANSLSEPVCVVSRWRGYEVCTKNAALKRGLLSRVLEICNPVREK